MSDQTFRVLRGSSVMRRGSSSGRGLKVDTGGSGKAQKCSSDFADDFKEQVGDDGV